MKNKPFWNLFWVNFNDSKEASPKFNQYDWEIYLSVFVVEKNFKKLN